MERKEEICLIQKIQTTGCVQSYTLLVTQLKLYRDVFHFVRRYLPNPSDAEEVTQEAMFRAFHHIQGFDPERGRFRAWVLGIAIHQAFDRLKERQHQSLCEIEDLPLAQRSPEEMFHLMEMEEALLSALDALGERYQRILVMYYVEGLPHKEIAEREGITINNAGTLLNRAKERCLDLVRERLSSRRKAATPALLSQAAQSFAELLSAINHRFLRHSGNR